MCSRSANSRLFIWALGADPDDGGTERGELGEAVAVGAALRSAAAGAGDVVPAGWRGLAGRAGAGVDVGDEAVREPAQPGRRFPPWVEGRRSYRQRHPGEVIGGTVVLGNRQVRRQLPVVRGHSAHPRMPLTGEIRRVGDGALCGFLARDEPRRAADQERRAALVSSRRWASPMSLASGQRQRGLRGRPRRRGDADARIEAGLAEALGYEVPVFLRSAAELRRSRPGSRSRLRWWGLKGQAPGRLSSSTRRRKRTKDALDLATDEDRLAIDGRELYWLPSGGMSESELDLKAIGAALGLTTIRTKGTVDQIAAKHFGSSAIFHGRWESAFRLRSARQRGEPTSRLTAPISSGSAESWTLETNSIGAGRGGGRIVVVGGDDHLGVEAREDPPPVVLGEAAAGDAGEEDVDAALADRLVDQVGAALVVEADPATSIEMPQTWPQR